MFFACSSLGIDIGNHSVRVALLKSDKRCVYVCNLIEENISDTSLCDVLAKIKQKLRGFLTFPFLLPKYQAIAVSQSLVAIKRLKLVSGLPEQEQYVQLGIQLSDHLGLPFEELLYDYHLLDSSTDTIEAYACRYSLVKEKLSALAKSGYQLSTLELQTQSLMRLYYKKTVHFNNKIALLVDLDVERIQLFLGSGKTNLFYRELPWPDTYSSPLSTAQKQNIAKQLSLDIIRQSKQIYTEFPYIKLKEIWLSGSNVEQLDINIFRQETGLKVFEFDPFESLNLSLLNTAPTSKGKWATAIGLALRGMNDAKY